MAPDPQLLVVYDGVCGLCSGLVAFLVARDADASRFRFAALQSGAGRAVLASHGISEADALDSFTVVQPVAPAAVPADAAAVEVVLAPFADPSAAVFRRSSAALTLASRLALPYRALAAVGWCVPRLLRDAVYDLVAANRYAWFGTVPQGYAATGGAGGGEGGENGGSTSTSTCLMPSARNLARFLDADEIKADAVKKRAEERAARAAAKAGGPEEVAPSSGGSWEGTETAARRRRKGVAVASS